MVESKQVRVDNWGVFFLQRLQMFFSKTDYCDLTLQFEGNVQLKVHRLVMSACTEYFMFLEQNCSAPEENTILMPSDLQSDVIVPIVNFMYTGMLEFHISIFDKLYKAAELMNITVLTKLLEAQKVQIQSVKNVKAKPESKPKVEQKKQTQKPVFTAPELPPAMPGRKVPVWKRKTAPTVTPPTSASHPTSQGNFCEEPRYSASSDPLAVSDNRPKPTRFEWPEDDLPPMDASFEDVSLTSKPLFTKEEEEKAKHCFDDLRNNVEIPARRSSARASSSSSNINTRAVEDYVKEQKIRSSMFEDVDDVDIGQKRKTDQISTSKAPPSKKLKISNKENNETIISVETTDATNIDHTKIVTEILKKYPDLVKKNKNIKLKIITSGSSRPTLEKKIPSIEVPKKQPEGSLRYKNQRNFAKKKPTITDEANEDGPWKCRTCIGIGGEAQEFVLYYLYRKHMTDVHDEIFDESLCKYCGRKCGSRNLMMYHMYTKHALKPPSSYNFPKCDRCPFIAFSEGRLNQHKEKHNPNEIQCLDCKLAFTCSKTLAAHTRVTGHYSKPGKVSYDCQYCMKKLQSSINLFTHIRNTHLKDATRDGIVCLEEIDSIEQLEDQEDEENNSSDEYIVPEPLPLKGMQKDKVKIISNVKVPPNLQSGDIVQQGKIIPLESSSEAESLNNVASGIATSLGLVDIVVLNENQQYIIQDGQHDQTEFIIPDLSPGQPFTGQVITTQHNTVIPQGMIQTSGSDIGSTDELVMVLTDHDYPDEHEGGHQENSNIVVLYSHPVEGHEGQFITSQGNLLVNSQTGMLEIRNGTTIATSSNQMVVTNAVDSPVESIEMIQREIDGHQELKQEPYFDEERKHVIQTQQVTEVVEIPENVVEEFREETVEHEICEQEEVPEEQVDDSQVEVVEQQEEHHDMNKSDDRVDGSMEEPMEIEEIEETSTTKENENQVQPVEVTVEEESPTETTETVEVEPQTQPADKQTQPVDEPEGNQIEGVDVPPEQSTVSSEVSEHVIVNDPTTLNMFEHPSVDVEEHTERVPEDEPMEVDGKIEESAAVEEQQQNTEIEEKEQDKLNEEKEQDKPNEDLEQKMPDEENTVENVEAVHPDESKEQAAEPNREEEVAEEEEVEEEEEESVEPATSEVHTDDPSETTSKSIADESPRQNQSHKQRNKSQLDINKTILDDWEDESDSQQSEKQAVSEEAKQSEESETTELVEPISKTTAAVDNVNKLMDDWEEEEEEEKKESE